VNLDFMLDLIVAEEKPASPLKMLRRWTREEDDFMRENLATLGIEGVAEELGRSKGAVKIRFTRKGIPAPSKRPGWLTGHDVARHLGVDIHSIMKWHKSGLMQFEVIPGERQILNIRKVTLYRWATRPEHWVYFKVKNMRDFHLKRLVIRAQELWGDRWLTIGEATRLIGYKESNTLNMRIRRGKVPGAIQNGNWYVRESVAKTIKFYHSSAAQQRAKTRERTRADDWMEFARYELEMTYPEIAVRMGTEWNEKRVYSRLKRLREFRDEVVDELFQEKAK